MLRKQKRKPKVGSVPEKIPHRTRQHVLDSGKKKKPSKETDNDWEFLSGLKATGLSSPTRP